MAEYTITIADNASVTGTGIHGVVVGVKNTWTDALSFAEGLYDLLKEGGVTDFPLITIFRNKCIVWAKVGMLLSDNTTTDTYEDDKIYLHTINENKNSTPLGADGDSFYLDTKIGHATEMRTISHQGEAINILYPFIPGTMKVVINDTDACADDWCGNLRELFDGETHISPFDKTTRRSIGSISPAASQIRLSDVKEGDKVTITYQYNPNNTQKQGEN